jgi:hypothetical protein
LFETIFRESTRRFIPRINAILASDVPLFEKIETFCEEYIGKIIESPFIPLFLLNEMNKQPHSFLKKMWGTQKPDLTIFIQQTEEAIRKSVVRPVNPMHLVMNMISLCVFPFVGKPILLYVSGMDESHFGQLMEQRKKEVPRFIIDSIKK